MEGSTSLGLDAGCGARSGAAHSPGPSAVVLAAGELGDKPGIREAGLPSYLKKIDMRMSD